MGKRKKKNKQELVAKLCQVFPEVIYFRVNKRDLSFGVRNFC